MAKQTEAQNPLILRCNRLIEAFAKSDDERDFYLDRTEGFIIYVDLDKSDEEIKALENELKREPQRYCLISKLTFYETKKIMEGFVNEKIYDADTKDKLIDIIQSKEARENFLDFIYDHHSELEKWQVFYQERSRIRIIEWLRANHFHFVFEEDLDIPNQLVEKLKKALFQAKVTKDIETGRKALIAKAKTYYSNEALNPRPKRGRPPKQALKVEFEPQITTDVFINVPNELRPFLFTPEFNNQNSSSFSSKFGYDGDLFSTRRSIVGDNDLSLEGLESKLATLRNLSSKWIEKEDISKNKSSNDFDEEIDFSIDDDDDDWSDSEEEDDFDFSEPVKKSSVATKKKAASKSTRITKEKGSQKEGKQAAKKMAKPLKKEVVKVKGKVFPKTSSKIASIAKSNEESTSKKLRPLMALKKKNSK